MRHFSVWALVAALTLLLSPVVAQSSNSTTPSGSLSLTTASTTITASTTSRGSVSQFTTVVVSTFNVTVTPTPTSTANSTSATASSSATPEPIALDTRLDPAFGVLGVILILTGLPSAFWGHKNRWTSFFLIGFYTLSLVCFVLILRFGVLRSINPPSKTLRGMFVLACGIAGFAGGAIAIFFWKAARYGIGGWGGFALALWIQCFHNGGLIKPVGFRWILYIGCAVVGFVLCTIPKIHYHVLLISTAIVGSSALILGVDCFTTANLKEFYVWNLGFDSLFTKFTSNGIQFPVSQTMEIELGLIGAIALMGIAVQLRIYRVLKRKLNEIAAEQRRQDEEAEIQAAGDFAHVLRDQEQWEKEHGGKFGGRESGSSMPLMKDHDGSTSPRSDTTHVDLRPRHPSGVSDFMAAPTPDDELKRATRGLQSPGALPTLDLGLDIKDDVPDDFMTHYDNIQSHTAKTEDMKKKDELRAEIETIRRSIDALKSGSPVPSSPSGSRHPSLTSRRTLSIDANSALLPTPSHLRPPRERDPRARVHSMDLMGNTAIGESIGRPTSAPLRDLDWDAYIQERKLLQPPQGVTPPIATTPIAPQSSRIQMPPAVAEALQQRKQRESVLGLGAEHSSSSEDIPLGQIDRNRHRRTRTNSAGGNIPVTILPPKKPIAAPTPQRPAQARTKTFEELNERHREKMRDIQKPLTTAETEQAQLQAAKQRWERAKAIEKEAVTRRQAEQATLLEKRKKSEDDQERRADEHGRRHSRSLSADKLGSKRLSTMKVEDWQRYQQEVEGPSQGRGRQRDSVPFPGQQKQRRRGRDMLG
ncbi:hypothetical protein K435DRAFT_643271 [Dendrothele bispora CBS 962.96]|uniref:TM7S3/TM198-like domain-containing protein n=1 Tax=Dendrothele bispora (strain CBS 962.96) TaxID=1314807 RepID=A0A4S8MX31_DENBC|nr:hypothetical protein K435DRAFT_643271 [Dendrothele bispora CBS 962.96]